MGHRKSFLRHSAIQLEGGRVPKSQGKWLSNGYISINALLNDHWITQVAFIVILCIGHLWAISICVRFSIASHLCRIRWCWKVSTFATMARNLWFSVLAASGSLVVFFCWIFRWGLTPFSRLYFFGDHWMWARKRKNVDENCVEILLFIIGIANVQCCCFLPEFPPHRQLHWLINAKQEL